MKKHIKKLHNTKTYSFIIVIAFAVIGATILVFSQAATPTASFSLNPSSRSADINTDFTVGVYVNSATDQPVNGVNLKLSYNTTQLLVKSITTTGTNFTGCPTATGTGGTIALTCYVTPPTTLTGSNLIANVTFTARVGTGNTTLAFVNESALISKIALSGTGENIWNGVTTGGTYTLTTPDTTPPTTVITDPISTSGPLSGTKTITATAVDSASTINRVEFLVDGLLKGSDTTSPYSYAWDTTTATDGAHTLSTRAYDNATTPNMGTSSLVNVTVSNSKPDLTVTSITTVPANPDTGEATTISAVIKNNGTAPIAAGVSKATRFSIDSTTISTVTDTSAVAVGASYTVTSTAAWTAVAGTKSITVAADVNGQIVESNESNNTLSSSRTILNPGDTGTTVGVVDFEDLLAVLNNWNTSGKTRLQGNLTGDTTGSVDFEDLLKVLNNWTK